MTYVEMYDKIRRAKPTLRRATPEQIISRIEASGYEARIDDAGRVHFRTSPDRPWSYGWRVRDWRVWVETGNVFLR